VQPVAGELILAGIGAALGDLVLVMGKDQIHPTGVYVEHIGAPLLADE
jgi:hypothetical protein